MHILKYLFSNAASTKTDGQSMNLMLKDFVFAHNATFAVHTILNMFSSFCRTPTWLAGTAEN